MTRAQAGGRGRSDAPERGTVTRREACAGFAALTIMGAPDYALAARAGRTPPLAATRAGKVAGYWDQGTAAFKGIPYAGPVDGVNRWKKPVPPEPWSGVRQATHLGPRAFQSDADNLNIITPDILSLLSTGAPPEAEWAPMGENCLTLNVWTPAMGSTARLPVMVWLHGGGFFGEVPPLWWNDGVALASSQEVVVVTVRHRLGPLGFLDLASLGATDLPDSGNAGMLDLVRALEWVHENIEGFGGDRDCVTIFGESGGGAKVSMLLGMPGAKGLFHRAIIQSGAGLRASDPAAAATRTKAILAQAGIDPTDLERARTLPAEVLIKAQSALLARRGDPSTGGMAGPVIDGSNLPAHPFDPEASALSADVPVMIGTNETESSLLLSTMPGVFDLDWEGATRALAAFAGPRAPSLIELYRKNRPAASPSEVFFVVTSDMSMRMPSITLAERKVRQGRGPVFMYLVNYRTNALGGRLLSPHGLEQPFVFNRPEIAFTGTDPSRVRLARQMSAAWAGFARHGQPNHPGMPHWTPYSLASRSTMVFDVHSRLIDDPAGSERLALAQIGGPGSR